MSVWNAWSVCDRCGFEYRRREMRKESTGILVCRACNDGAFDAKRHPQNRGPAPKKEPSIVPDGTPPIELTPLLATEEVAYILTEDGQRLEIEPLIWTPRQSVYH